MLKTMLKLESNINGLVAHLYIEMGSQPMTTNMISDFCLDFIKQLGVIEAQNKAHADAEAAALLEKTEGEEPMPGIEAPQCCLEGQCNQE